MMARYRVKAPLCLLGIVFVTCKTFHLIFPPQAEASPCGLQGYANKDLI